jgi:hypothetical protein
LLYAIDHRADEAERLLQGALQLTETTYGADHPNVAHILNVYAKVLRLLGRSGAAGVLAERANGIIDKSVRDNGLGYSIQASELELKTTQAK